MNKMHCCKKNFITLTHEYNMIIKNEGNYILLIYIYIYLFKKIIFIYKY